MQLLWKWDTTLMALGVGNIFGDVNHLARKGMKNKDEVNRRNVQMQRRGSIYPEAMRVKGRSYADAVTGHNGRNARMQMNETNRGVKQIWKAKTSEQNWTGLEFNPKHENWKWLEGCYVGTARSVEIVPVIQERLYMEGLFSVKVRAMGGRMVLLDGEDKEELKDLMESAAEWLSQWFDEILPWTSTMVASDRFVWLKIMGVPLKAWGDNFFSTIANLWGKFISLDDSTRFKKRFDVARVLISTTQLSIISRLLRIKVDGQFYNIMCREEEGSNGYFNIKTDYNLDFQSNSNNEDLELWSTDHYSGEEFDDDSHVFRRSSQSNWSEEDDGEEDVDMALGKVQEIQKIQIVDETSAECINEVGGGSGESGSSKELSMVEETLGVETENLLPPQCHHEDLVGVGSARFKWDKKSNGKWVKNP
ncbi:hypothetical protein SLEP1_g40691 [Rubroshorea leprosula]|uniref:DUF4283 domain-containing protein n=1 Tax=Rubroshorea leprosula TaxID=152421 RepID=A0AAV5L4D2_9ROSI|nr:hypothetical protein SLEP1_g40691 [Rubroshorea leprosula]